MNDLAALYAAILAHPAEDTPRLMFADELDAAGGKQNCARAKFIRLMISLPRDYGPNWRTKCNGNSGGGWVTKTLVRNWTDYMRTPALYPVPVTHPNWAPGQHLRVGNHVLKAHHAAEIWYPLPFNHNPQQPLAMLGTNRLVFQRGFVSHVACNWFFWRDFGDIIVRHDPIATVTLTSWPRGQMVAVGEGLIKRFSHYQFDGDPVEVPFEAIKAWEDAHPLDLVKVDLNRLVVAVLSCRWPSVAEWQLPPSSPSLR